jgi:hypothetical protein
LGGANRQLESVGINFCQDAKTRTTLNYDAEARIPEKSDQKPADKEANN